MPAKILKSKLIELDKYNKIAIQKYEDKTKESYPNGIACPNCKNELVDESPHLTLMSYPPKKKILCPACGYRGHRIA